MYMSWPLSSSLCVALYFNCCIFPSTYLCIAKAASECVFPISISSEVIRFVRQNRCYSYRGQRSLVMSLNVLNNNSPSSLSKEDEHRSSCKDFGTLSILMCYFTSVQRRYLSQAHILTNFK